MGSGLLETGQFQWVKMQQATVHQATTGVDAHVLSYGTTWASAAQNPANRPGLTTAANTGEGYGITMLPQECNRIELQFAVADTDNDEFTAVLWAWAGNGPGIDLVRIDSILAGSSVVSTDPYDQATLTNFRYADTITIDENNIYARRTSADDGGTANGIAKVYVDTIGYKYLYMSYDSDAGSGTTGTDCIAWYRQY